MPKQPKPKLKVGDRVEVTLEGTLAAQGTTWRIVFIDYDGRPVSVCPDKVARFLLKQRKRKGAGRAS